MKHRSRYLWPALFLLSGSARTAEPLTLDGPVALDLRVTRSAPGSPADSLVVCLNAAGASANAILRPGKGELQTRNRRPTSSPEGLPEPGRSDVYRLIRRSDSLVFRRGDRQIGVSRRPPVGPTDLVLRPQGCTVEIERVQPLEPVHASDDFARGETDLGAWERVSGDWRIAAYRDPLVAKYGLPAQASWLVGRPQGEPALILTGEDFWGDVLLSVDVRHDSGRAGIAFAVASERRYGLARITADHLEVVAVSDGREQTLCRVPFGPEPDAWQRLMVACSNGHVRVGANDEWLGWCEAPEWLDGRVGLWCDSPASFDNFRAEEARLRGQTFGPDLPDDQWDERAGPWQARPEGLAGWVHRGSQPALMVHAEPFDAGTFETRLKLPRDGEAGVRLELDRRPVTLTLVRRGAALNWRLAGTGEEPAGGPLVAAATEWHDLAVQRRGAGFDGLVDGQVVATWYDTGGPALAGITVLGPNGALFGRGLLTVAAIGPAAELFHTDFSQTELPGKQKGETWRLLGDVFRPETPEWRLRPPDRPDGGHLVCQAGARPTRIWYRDAPPGDIGLGVQLDELAQGARLALLAPEGGYRLELTGGEFRLCRGDVLLAARKLDQPPLLARLWRDGEWVAAEVDGQRVAHRDPAPPGAGRVGLEVSGGRVALATLTVTAESAFATPFRDIDCGWRQVGPWRWNSGMACIAWSYWITGDGRDGPTWLWRRRPLAGEATVRVHVSEYTDGYEDGDETHQHFPYHDVSVVLSGDGHDPDSGYRFIIGADGGKCARLLRRGEVVAENRRFTIVMGSHCNEPRSIYVEAGHQAGRLTLRLNGAEALRWDDPDPLDGGYIALGVAGCRANFSDLSALRRPVGE